MDDPETAGVVTAAVSEDDCVILSERTGPEGKPSGMHGAHHGSGNQLPMQSRPSSEAAIAPTKPSREAAEMRRKMTLILDPATGDFMPLTSSPAKIGTVSTGLGIYMETLRMYCVFSAINVIIFLYPLALNIATNNFDLGWELMITGSASGDQNSTFECNLNSSSSLLSIIGMIPRTTPSSFCLDSQYTSPVLCPSRCIYNETEAFGRVLPNGTTCREVLSSAGVETWAADLSQAWTEKGACMEHSPDCGSSALAFCTCCAPLELVKEELGTYPAGAFAVMLISQAVFIAWMLLLWKRQITCAQSINRKVVTLPDYTLWVKGLPRECTDNRKVADFFRHYGEVVSASTVIPVGEVVTTSQRIKEMRITLQELRAKAALEELGAEDGESESGGACCRSRSLGHWLYWWLLSGSRSASKAAEALEERIELEKQKRMDAEINAVRGLRNEIGEALVTMNYEMHKKNAIIDNQGGSSHVCLKWLRRRHGWQNSTQMDGHAIEVIRAPEPCDYIWENTSHRDRTKRKLYGYVIFFVAVAVACAMQYFMQSLAEEERTNRVDAILDREINGAPDPEDLLSYLGDLLSKNYLAMINALLISTLNIIVSSVQVWTSTNIEKWSTSSNREASDVVKVSVFYLLNSFGIPVLAAYLNFKGGDTGRDRWFLSGGVIESLFWIQVFNAALGDILALLGIFRLLNTHVFSHHAVTQDQLDKLLELPAASVSVRYASAVKTLGLGMLTAPVLPLSAILTLIGLGISYWTDKVLFLRLSPKPPRMSYKFTKGINRILLLLPVLQLLLMRFLYFSGQPNINPIFIAGMVLWAVFAFGFEPIRQALGVKRVRTREDDGTQGRSYQETLGKALLDDRATRRESDAQQQRDMPQIPIYRPPIPPQVCTNEFRAMIEHHFANESEGPLPPILTLLEDQVPFTGGDAALPPSLNPISEVAVEDSEDPR